MTALSVTNELAVPYHLKYHVSLQCILTLVLVSTATFAQRPPYAPFPWDERYTQTIDPSYFTTPTPESSADGRKGLVDRFGGTEYKNKILVSPCIGCIYLLTNQGFRRIKAISNQKTRKMNKCAIVIDNAGV
ncbi:hypothetical protein B566_EDAN007540 [Ephemera danica]|nr:hypothetical protein B566_EDAN007540 [Ephemera danica]